MPNEEIPFFKLKSEEAGDFLKQSTLEHLWRPSESAPGYLVLMTKSRPGFSGSIAKESDPTSFVEIHKEIIKYFTVDFEDKTQLNDALVLLEGWYEQQSKNTTPPKFNSSHVLHFMRNTKEGRSFVRKYPFYLHPLLVDGRHAPPPFFQLVNKTQAKEFLEKFEYQDHVWWPDETYLVLSIRFVRQKACPFATIGFAHLRIDEFDVDFQDENQLNAALAVLEKWYRQLDIKKLLTVNGKIDQAIINGSNLLKFMKEDKTAIAFCKQYLPHQVEPTNVACCTII